jgi:hypothetical protein
MSFARAAPAICRLLNNVMLSFHFKNQIWQSKFSTMDHKSRVHFTIISHYVDLDKILETDDVGNSSLAKPVGCANVAINEDRQKVVLLN